MPGSDSIRKRQEELIDRQWPITDIEASFNRLVQNGIPSKTLDREKMLREKEVILDRVQRRAEDYCYLMRNCAKSSATALFEEFSLGSLDIVRGLGPFPGLAMSGGICGPVAGGLIALGLFFSPPDITKHDDAGAYLYARMFINRFESAFGSLYCPDIQKKLLGKYYDPMSSMENLKAFNASGARKQCVIAPGIGARIAAEIILESMAR
ncbi:MAG TPA: C-GCAxxG-C-C family (seleno)protein [Smithellaceae bacterium]|nr:C-GCAxxG-C-C family (seleno)protein [Smithellaceae bacterium]HRS84001.1 C-GCAxxG-C-C family (seleno)protein [Smithellaceae bacterium]HRV44551.1 C-GCAxxG-C-C family (seleno)protein [Smithellaceae bacterium]